MWPWARLPPIRSCLTEIKELMTCICRLEAGLLRVCNSTLPVMALAARSACVILGRLSTWTPVRLVWNRTLVLKCRLPDSRSSVLLTEACSGRTPLLCMVRVNPIVLWQIPRVIRLLVYPGD